MPLCGWASHLLSAAMATSGHHGYASCGLSLLSRRSRTRAHRSSQTHMRPDHSPSPGTWGCHTTRTQPYGHPGPAPRPTARATECPPTGLDLRVPSRSVQCWEEARFCPPGTSRSSRHTEHHPSQALPLTGRVLRFAYLPNLLPRRNKTAFKFVSCCCRH